MLQRRGSYIASDLIADDRGAWEEVGVQARRMQALKGLGGFATQVTLLHAAIVSVS